MILWSKFIGPVHSEWVDSLFRSILRLRWQFTIFVLTDFRIWGSSIFSKVRRLIFLFLHPRTFLFRFSSRPGCFLVPSVTCTNRTRDVELSKTEFPSRNLHIFMCARAKITKCPWPLLSQEIHHESPFIARLNSSPVNCFVMLNAFLPRTLFFYDGAMEAINAFNIYAGALVKIYERNKSSKKNERRATTCSWCPEVSSYTHAQLLFIVCTAPSLVYSKFVQDDAALYINTCVW